MSLTSFSLENQVAVVTGGGRGIGRTLAVGLAAAGADVAVVSRTEADLAAVAGEIRRTGRRAFTVQADMSRNAEIERAIGQVAAEAGKIDILVNNAGINIRTPALDVTDGDWDKIVGTNMKGAFFAAQAAARVMKEHGYGRIVNVASVAGQVAVRSGVVYSMTKAAIIQMTRTLALEWGKYGINVNAIGPWYVKTPLTAKVLANQSYVEEILARTIIKRLEEPEDLVGAVVFLSAPASAYMTGQTLFVDGGLTVYGF